MRGLHSQMPTAAQSKLISVIEGKVLDVVVDIRKGSPNFGKHITVELSSKNQKQLFIPRGFAHGYACSSKIATVIYHVDNYYNQSYEASIAFDDPQLNIDWQLPANKIILSEKDKSLPRFKSAQFFDYNQSLYD
jgi:dTDP-4-dehydrorhamnose 3,5-epimerase